MIPKTRRHNTTSTTDSSINAWPDSSVCIFMPPLTFARRKRFIDEGRTDHDLVATAGKQSRYRSGHEIVFVGDRNGHEVTRPTRVRRAPAAFIGAYDARVAADIRTIQDARRINLENVLDGEISRHGAGTIAAEFALPRDGVSSSLSYRVLESQLVVKKIGKI